jgi:HEPN domain-containing protein
MSAAENLITEITRWVAKAEEDIRVAEYLIKIDNAQWSTICFHAQQCAEKYLKGLLLWRGIGFPKTFVFVDQIGSERHHPKSLAALAAAFTDYKS